VAARGERVCVRAEETWRSKWEGANTAEMTGLGKWGMERDRREKERE
jgi:hypothetical protein